MSLRGMSLHRMSLHRMSLHLRAATAAAHRDLEQALDWQVRVATRPGYRALLARLHGFHAAYEPAIGRALSDPAFWEPRRRLAALAADLAYLGLADDAIAALPRPEPVRLATADAMGALYVLEGSTLGGQVIGRHIGALHGLDHDGLAYYRAHGRRTGLMWNLFRARLDALSGDPQMEGAVTEAAVATFGAMRVWLCGDEVPGTPAAATGAA